MSGTTPGLFTRREFLAGGVATAGLVTTAGATQTSTGPDAGAANGAFPTGFLWGAAVDVRGTLRRRMRLLSSLRR